MNKAGRPYRLHPAEDGREFRSELPPMPTTEELLASLSTHSKEEIMVLAFARGASTGYKRGLRRDVNGSVGYDHHAPPLRGRRPRRLRRETALPGSQRIPRTAATSSELPPVGTRAAARPAPWL